MNEVDRDEELRFGRAFFNLVIYAEKKSSSTAEVCATKIMEDDIVYPSPYRWRLPSPTLPLYQLLGVSSTTSNL